MIKSIFYFLVFLMCFTTQGQVDSLKKCYPKQKGKEQVQTIIDIAYALSSVNTKESKYYGSLAEKKAKALGDSTMLATVWNDWSFTYMHSAELDSFLLLNQQALHYRTLLKDSLGMGKSLNKIGIAYYEKGMFQKSLDANFKCVAIFKKLKQESFLGQVYMNIGAAFTALKNFDQSYKYNKLAKEIAFKYNDYGPYIRSTVNLGVALKGLNRINEARIEYESVIEMIKEFQLEEELATVYQNLGVLERESNNYQKGIEYYEGALDIYRKIKNKNGISLILGNLANCYLDKNDIQSAEKLLDEALKVSKEIKSYTSIMKTYQILARLESARGNYAKSEEHIGSFMAYNDSINNEKSTKAIAEMQVKYESEERELELSNEKIKNKNKTILLLSLGILAFLLALIIVYVSQKKKLQRKKLELQTTQKLESERGRISRDLHDNLGAELTLIASKIDLKLFKSNSESEKDELNDIGDLTRSANHLLRETIWSIHQNQITLSELSSKSETYAKRIFENSKVELFFETKNESTILSPAIALHLFRIIQESVNNSFKYSQCSKLTLTFDKDLISISDNGIGFDIDTVQKGYGMQNIAQRVKEIAGKLSVKSSDLGTIISVEF